MKSPFIVILLSSLLCLSWQTEAQETITGSIDEWQEGEAKIVFMDMFNGYTRVLGSIDSEGNFEIPLEENFLTTIKQAMQKEQEKASENRVISLKDLQGTYSCDVGDLDYENPKTKLTALPQQLIVVAEKKMLGMLSPVSNPAIAEWITSYQQDSTGKGKYLEWVYLEDDARVNGECYSHGFLDNDVFQKDYNFDLDLQKGWNLIQHEIQETLQDEQGKIYPKKIEVTTITEIPEDVQWRFRAQTR